MKHNRRKIITFISAIFLCQIFVSTAQAESTLNSFANNVLSIMTSRVNGTQNALNLLDINTKRGMHSKEEKREIIDSIKRRTNEHFNYAYASLDDFLVMDHLSQADRKKLLSTRQTIQKYHEHLLRVIELAYY